MMLKRMTLALAFGLGAPPYAALAHSEGQTMHTPFQPQAQIAVNDRWGRFSIVVHPNLVEYPRASSAALAESARYCQSIGKSAPAAFRYVRRHSDHVLDGWEFGGRCE